jgi:hypothetical protein
MIGTQSSAPPGARRQRFRPARELSSFEAVFEDFLA